MFVSIYVCKKNADIIVVEAENFMNKTFYREMQITYFSLNLSNLQDILVYCNIRIPCYPQPIMERKRVCKHTLLRAFQDFITKKIKAVRNGMEG